MLSKTNSIRCDKYIFQPKRYDENDNLICCIYKRNIYRSGRKFINKDKCKLTGVYDFDNRKFDIIWESEEFMNASHKKMLNWFLKQYDWLD